MEHIEKADIQSIEVHNDNGTYTMYRGDDDQFYLEGNEGAPYSMTALSLSCRQLGYTLSMTRVTEDCSDMSVYGLAESDNPAWYVLPRLTATTIKYIGDMIPHRRRILRQIRRPQRGICSEASLAATLLADVRDIITPILSYPISSTTYSRPRISISIATASLSSGSPILTTKK